MYQVHYCTHSSLTLCVASQVGAQCIHAPFSDAKVACETEGARLCTLDELEAMEASGSGYASVLTGANMDFKCRELSGGQHSSAAGNPNHWEECT